MNTIQEINSRIIAKGNQVALETKDAIIKITLHGTQIKVVPTSKDVPSRPWMITGGACVAAGIIGTLSSESNWPYYIGALGLVSLGIGFTKRNQQTFIAKGQDVSSVSFDDEKAFIIERCNKILDVKKGEWDSFMESIKIEVQSLIKRSSIPEEKKEHFLSLTYYPETLSLSTLPLIDKFDAIDNSADVTAQIIDKKNLFANEVSMIISRTANQQVQSYNKIIL